MQALRNHMKYLKWKFTVQKIHNIEKAEMLKRKHTKFIKLSLFSLQTFHKAHIRSVNLM